MANLYFVWLDLRQTQLKHPQITRLEIIGIRCFVHEELIDLKYPQTRPLEIVGVRCVMHEELAQLKFPQTRPLDIIGVRCVMHEELKYLFLVHYEKIMLHFPGDTFGYIDIYNNEFPMFCALKNQYSLPWNTLNNHFQYQTWLVTPSNNHSNKTPIK